MPVRLNGSTSGYVELKSPAVAGTTSLELPTDSIKPGLVLVSETTFSAASTVSVNNCFSSTYANYRVMVDLNSNTTVAEMRLRMRASGTDSTASNYSTQHIRGSDTSVSGTRFPDTSFYPGYCSYSTASIDFYNPFATAYTQFQAQNPLSTAVSTSALQYWVSGGIYFATTSYDGFTLYPNTGNVTGSIRVYGYRNSL